MELLKRINQSCRQELNILTLVSTAETCYQLIDLVKFGKESYCLKLTNTIILKDKKMRQEVEEDNCKNLCSLWNMDNVMYYDDDNFDERVF